MLAISRRCSQQIPQILPLISNANLKVSQVFQRASSSIPDHLHKLKDTIEDGRRIQMSKLNDVLSSYTRIFTETALMAATTYYSLSVFGPIGGPSIYVPVTGFYIAKQIDNLNTFKEETASLAQAAKNLKAAELAYLKAKRDYYSD